MPNYLRNYVYGGFYFFTIVTYKRMRYFDSDQARGVLLENIEKVRKAQDFDLIAYCIMPDHLHLLIKLPVERKDFSYLIREIKRLTTLEVRKSINNPTARIWQNRFWEHTIRDEEDLQNHFDYIHFNPRKHGYVDDPIDWEWSSYRSSLGEGFYPTNKELRNPEDKKGFGYGE